LNRFQKMPARSKSSSKDSTANRGFEAKLWLAADKLRNNMDAADPKRRGDSQQQAVRRASETRQYKHGDLGLILTEHTLTSTFMPQRDPALPAAWPDSPDPLAPCCRTGPVTKTWPTPLR